MRCVKVAAAALAFNTLLAGVVCSQVPSYSVQPSSAEQANSSYAANDQGAPGVRPAAYVGEEPSANGNGEEQEKEESKPWKLFHGSWLADHNVNINGWVDMGITGNPDNPPSRYNGVLAPNDRNEFDFNQVYLVMEKTIDTKKHNWDIGGRVDLLYGTDWIYGASLGLETHPDGTPRWNSGFFYGIGMPQAYFEGGHGDLSVKLGHFYTTIGYESLMPVNNFFYSMNYALRYAEPTAHTGGLFTWKKSEDLSFFVGGVNGQDRFDGEVDTLCLLTGFAYAPKEEKYAFNFAIMTGGTEPGIRPVAGGRTYFSTYLTYNFTKKWQSVTQFDAGWQQNFDLAGHTADFWSVTQYLFYKINDKWKAGLRYDIFVDDQGTRLGGLRFGGLPSGNPLPAPPAPGTPGFPGAVQAISAGLNFTPHTNIRLRPEIRWDWFDGAAKLFDDQTKNSQLTVAIDAIVLY